MSERIDDHDDNLSVPAPSAQPNERLAWKPPARVPDDIAAIIRSALLNYEYTLEAFYDGQPQALAAAAQCRAALTWLDTQTQQEEEMSEWTWEPVTDDTLACDCGQCSRSISVDDGILEIFDDEDGETLTAHLPASHALCRRVPGTSAGVPVEVRNIIHTALENLRITAIPIADGEARLHELIDNAIAWLDAQTQQETSGESS